MKLLHYFLIAALLLASCGLTACAQPTQGTEASSSAIGQETSATPTNFWMLHNTTPGAAKSGLGEDGLYYLQYTQDGTGNLQLLYLDYATAQTHVLCASPECVHNSEACTGWFPGNYGSGSTWVVDNSVYICFRGSDPEKGTTVFPQMIRMDADGRNRKRLISFSGSVNMMGSFATDGTSVYIMEKSFQQKEGSFETKTKLLQIDLTTGERTEKKEWDSDVWIASACPGYLILMVPENFDTNGFEIFQHAAGAAYNLVGFDANGNETPLLFIVENGFVGAVRGDSHYALDMTTNVVTRTNLLTGEAIELCTLPRGFEKNKAFWGELVGDKLFISGTLAQRPNEIDIKTAYIVNVNKGDCTEINLRQEDPNLPNNDNPVRIIAQWQDEYLTANRIMMYQVAYIDETGTKQIMNAMDTGYAMISKDDLLSSTPNYRNVEPPV